MTSTFAVAGVLALAIALYLWWERSDQAKEAIAAKVADDVKAMGDVVAASLSPRVNPDLCIGSGACVAACPEKVVIALIRGQAELVNPLGCIGHGVCATSCPVGAISLVYGTKTRGVELPLVDPHFQTHQPGVYIAGELGGMGLIRNAVIQGQQAAEHIIEGSPREGRPPRRGSGDALDAIVVGAGPAGISATLRLMEAGLKVQLMDREGFGGTILHYPRGKLVMTGPVELPLYGKLRQRQLSKEQLVEVWQDIAAKTNPPLITGELVTRLSKHDAGVWGVVSEDQHGIERVRCAANVVLALGGRGSPRKLGVPGEQLSKVAYRLLEPEPFAGQHVLVVGGGNSAVETALSLADFGGCASVSISYRRAQFARCRAENQARIAECIGAGSVIALMSTQLHSIEADSVTLSGDQGTGQKVRNDAVIVQIGGMPPSALLKSFGVRLVTKYGER
jgi:thioredoxin reductase/NAD-dependent dihydropyrimidine dehydrogenase PreA subunit